MKRKSLMAILLIIPLLSLVACGGQMPAVAAEDDPDASVPVRATPAGTGAVEQPAVAEETGGSEEEEELARAAGWTEETHGKSADPNYEVVFPDEQVNRIDIVIAPENWQAMLDDMTENYGEFGVGPGRGGGNERGAPPGGARPQDGQIAPGGGQRPPQGGMAPPNGNPGQGPGPQRQSENPIWVPADVEFDGQTWTSVGVRFKGNSSLWSAWREGIWKLPFKLDFDQFEDDHPEIDDQRFYGFKRLTLANSFHDESFLHETIAADAFRAAGVPAAETAFYRVYVDYGEGPVYFGLYIMVEVVDDTVIEVQFDDDGGNLYKPEGAGASFAYGTFNEADFDKETNGDEADWSDVRALYEVLHSEQRTGDPSGWRTCLEAIFDVDVFLRWLATNTVMQNWDAYGVIGHNYYLYNNPTTGQLTWIAWDLNSSLRENIDNHRAPSLSMDEVSERWPLIRYLLDDEAYHARYVAYVAEVSNDALEPEAVAARCRDLHDLIEPYVTGDAGEQAGYTFLSSPEAFDTACTQLIKHVNSRYSAAQAYVNSQ